MRDIKRIKPFCDRLAKAWERVPDWRFGQLMCNILGAMGKDPFFPEDDEMLGFIEKYFGIEKSTAKETEAMANNG